MPYICANKYIIKYVLISKRMGTVELVIIMTTLNRTVIEKEIVIMVIDVLVHMIYHV